MLSSSVTYLVKFGHRGELGFFAVADSWAAQRGQRVLVQSQRGQELGEILCRASPRHRQLLGNFIPGRLLRPATEADESRARAARRQALEIVAALGQFIDQHHYPVIILDLELFLDGQGILQYLGPPAGELPDLVQIVRRDFALSISLQNLAAPSTCGECAGCARACCGGEEIQAAHCPTGCGPGQRRWSLL